MVANSNKTGATGPIVIENISPSTPSGRYPAKAVEAERVLVSADVFKDGHEALAVRAKWRHKDDAVWNEVPMILEHSDRFHGAFVPEKIGMHEFVVEAKSIWDYGWETFDDTTESLPNRLWVDRQRALFGSWYELFPRSEGGLAGTARRIPAIASMGFDVLYLPPIHPVGTSHRKGANNTLEAKPGDPGSPWSIGSSEGGHTAIHPELGTFKDFDKLVAAAASNGMEIALDYALQCSPDHPWVSEHPEWFKKRPDGSIRYAENPPKKYQDIYPLNFWTDEGREELWDACKQIFDFWIERGVKIFRVDNPHTKPVAFWEWVVPAIQEQHPDVLFLAEAFTTPAMMSKLAEIGFTQSYTYFTWRTSKQELVEYLEELAHGPKADYMRPNLWPNTPDILSGPLRRGTIAAFAQRLILASTMSPSYGIYSGYEYGENEPASDEDEEYFNSEKYEIKNRDHSTPASLTPLVSTLNALRKGHPALQRLRNIRFIESSNPQVIAFIKKAEDSDDVMLVAVNLDVIQTQTARCYFDLAGLGAGEQSLRFHDELGGAEYRWSHEGIEIVLDPKVSPAALLAKCGEH